MNRGNARQERSCFQRETFCGVLGIKLQLSSRSVSILLTDVIHLVPADQIRSYFLWFWTLISSVVNLSLFFHCRLLKAVIRRQNHLLLLSLIRHVKDCLMRSSQLVVYLPPRYRAIVKPLDSHRSNPTLSISLRVGSIWLLSLTLAVPEAIFSDLHTFTTITNETFVTCAPYPHAGELHPMIHSTASFLVFYVLPLLIISVYYVFIARSLVSSSADISAEGHVHLHKQVCFKLQWLFVHAPFDFIWTRTKLAVQFVPDARDHSPPGLVQL